MKRKCKICKKPARFPTAHGHGFCGDSECGVKLYYIMREKEAKLRAKKERADLRKRKEALLTVSDWTKKAQRAFNAYIRERDRDQPCISCGKFERPNSRHYRGAGSWDAGHYRSIGSCPELRFDPDNCHKQHSRPCNKDLSGDAVNYRKRLIKKIGIDKVEWLEGPHEPKRYRIDELKEIEAYWKAELKKIKG